MFPVSSMIEKQALRTSAPTAKYAEMFSAMRDRTTAAIMQRLLAAHPERLVELEIPNSILSRHLDKLRTEDLVVVKREGTFLHAWKPNRAQEAMGARTTPNRS